MVSSKRGRPEAARSLSASVPGEGSERRQAVPCRLCAEDGMNDGLVKILDGNTFVVSDANGDIEASLTDPTGLFSSTRASSEVGADGERTAAGLALGRRSSVLRGPVLPRSRYRDRLHRRKALGDPPRSVGNGFHEELTILNHSEKPVSPHRSRRCGMRFRRPVRGEGRAAEEGHVHRARSAGETPRPRLRACDVPAFDVDLGDGSCAVRQGRSDVQDPDRATGRMDDRPRRGYGSARSARRSGSAS